MLSPAPSKHLQVSTTAEGTTVCLSGWAELDAAAAMEVRDEVLDLINRDRISQVHFSLAGAERLTSTMLAALIVINKRLKSRGGRLVVIDVPPRILEVFEVSRVNLLMEVRPQRAARPDPAA
jgi:anti-sigma B factor antagonist/stage II sporulation protein AA (anti-sigma F factor antagonist)